MYLVAYSPAYVIRISPIKLGKTVNHRSETVLLYGCLSQIGNRFAKYVTRGFSPQFLYLRQFSWT